ncbi:MAG: NAD(P)-dependent oxidoreductase [Candidatus Obscuribacterales bacterium]|nr:NAD(P)-dependent oxidoreductase [Candidatus Obscuribacterales bacterium]
MSLAIVTGTPGWLGNRLLETLLTGMPEVETLKEVKSEKVRALCLPNLIEDGKLKELVKQADGKLELVKGDLAVTDPQGHNLHQLFKNAEGATVFHVAGVIHPSRGVKEFYDVNVEGTRRMLEEAKKQGVKRFIHVSSNSPIGVAEAGNTVFDENSQYNPYMNYGKSKKLAEDLVNQAGREGKLETVIIRPPWFYGIGQPARQTLFFTMVKNGKAPIVGSGENLRSMAYVDNICQGLLLCREVQQAAGRTYWIADKEPYKMNFIVDTIEKVLSQDFNIKCKGTRMHLPNLASEVALGIDATLQSLGLYHQKFHVLSEMNKNIACSVALAEKELGYKPTIALEEGMRRSIDWVLKNGQSI